MKIIPTSEQIQYVKNLLDKGMGNRGSFDGDYYKRLFGFIGEIIIHDLLGTKRPTDLSKPDNGYDLIVNNKKYDVKVAIRNTPYKQYYDHNIAAYQINYNVDGYIFLSYNQNNGEFTICGIISKKDFLEHSKFYREGDEFIGACRVLLTIKCDCYKIKTKHLTKFRNIETFIKCL